MITSVKNPKIKSLVKLRKARQRKREDLILVEGYKEITLAQEAGMIARALYYSLELAGGKGRVNTLMAHETVELSADVFKRISLRENPDGLLALVEPKYLSLDEIKLGSRALVVVLEAVEKPGNLGAVLRTADGAGADAVIACEAKTDIYNPNVIRASLGTVFTGQVAVAGNRETYEWLECNGILPYVATPQTRKSYTEADFAQSTAVVIGEEHRGVSPFWLKGGIEKIKIPMKGRIDSLNASVSAAVVLYEAVRQRGG